MAMMTFKIEGTRQVAKWLQNVNKEIKERVSEEMQKIGEFMAFEVQNSIRGIYMPEEQKSFDTGNLMGSIKSIMIGKYVVSIGTNVEYAPYVEYGHILRNGVWWEGHHNFANRFFANQKKINLFISDAVKRSIKSAG